MDLILVNMIVTTPILSVEMDVTISVMLNNHGFVLEGLQLPQMYVLECVEMDILRILNSVTMLI